MKKNQRNEENNSFRDIINPKGVVALKRYRPLHARDPRDRYNGIFAPERGDLELDSQIVSSSEMTGECPLRRYC